MHGSVSTSETGEFASERSGTQSAQSERAYADSAEVTPRDLFALLLREKWFIICGTVLLAAVALIASLILPKKYEATVLIAPVSTMRHGGAASGIGSMLSGLGGLASMVGVSSLDMSKAEDIATLKSEILTQKFIQQDDLLPILYASKWDARRNRWRTTNPKDIPTLWYANRYFAKHVRDVTEDGTTGLYRLTITWSNPSMAANWANGIVALTNLYLRNKAIREDERNIAYLKKQADKTTMVEVKQAIFGLIQQEIRDAMIANGEKQYALKVIDPAFAPEKQSSPLPLLWTAIGFLVGLFGSCAVVVMKARQGASRAMSRRDLPQPTRRINDET